MNNDVNMPNIVNIDDTIDYELGNPEEFDMPEPDDDIPLDLDPNDCDNMQWNTVNENNDPGFDHNFIFLEEPVPKHCPPHDANPIYNFFMFFFITILSKFVTETNRYATLYIAKHSHTFSPNSRARQWRPVTLAEIRRFIAVIINMGLHRKPNIQCYWATSDSQYCPWYGKMLSRARFESILQFLSYG